MAQDLAVKVVAIAVFAVLLLVPLVALLRSLRSGNLLSLLQSILKHARRAMRKPNEAEIDEVALIVRAKTQQMKVEHFRTACSALSVVTTLWVAVAARQFMLDSSVLTWDAGFEFEGGSLGQQLGMALMHCVLVVVLVCPRLVTWRTIDLFYCALVLLSMVVVTSPSNATNDYIVYQLLIMHLPIALMNMVRRNIRVVGPLNTAFALVSAYTVTVHADRLGLPSWRIIVAECFFLVAFAGLAQALDASIESTIRQGLEMETTKELLSAASALLRSCCDVVVEIDREGLILSPALDLGGFLLRGPDCCLQNFKLSELMCYEEDRRMFLRQLHAERPSGLGLAEAIHARMRDGNDNLLRMEILFFEFQRMSSQPRYMVGLREFSDTLVGGKIRRSPEESVASLITFTDDRRSPEASARSLVMNADDEDQREEEAGSVPSFATSQETISDYYDSNSAEAPVAFVDCTDPALPILGCSAAFRMFIGRVPPGSHMNKLVKHGEDFARWVQTAAASAMHGEDCPDCRVTLQMRQGQLKATCRVLREVPRDGGSAEEGCDLEHTRLLFFNIKRCRGRGSTMGGTVGPLSLNASRSTSLRGTPVVHMAL